MVARVSGAFQAGFRQLYAALGGGSAPTEPPLMADSSDQSVLVSGTNSASITGYTPDPGNNRRIFAGIGVRGTGGSAVSVSVTGTTGTVTMDLILLQASRVDNDPALSFEWCAALDIPENAWPGDAPYDITATITHTGTASNVSMQIGTVLNAPQAASAIAGSRASPAAAIVTPTTDDSLVVTSFVGSSYSSAARWESPAEQFGVIANNGADTHAIGYQEYCDEVPINNEMDRTLGRHAVVTWAYPASSVGFNVLDQLGEAILTQTGDNLISNG